MSTYIRMSSGWRKTIICHTLTYHFDFYCLKKVAMLHKLDPYMHMYHISQRLLQTKFLHFIKIQHFASTLLKTFKICHNQKFAAFYCSLHHCVLINWHYSISITLHILLSINSPVDL